MTMSITWEQFEAVDIRIGTIVHAEVFEGARRPAYKLRIDLGELGIKQSSAQITRRYTPEALIGRQVVCCVNLGTKQIGSFVSEVLTTGFYLPDGSVVLAIPEQAVPNGAKLA